MALPLTSIPAEFIAGDTFHVVLSIPDYPAPTFYAYLFMRTNGLPVIQVNSTAYGTEHLFSVSGGSTGNGYWPAATYDWSLRVANPEPVTVDTGRITILPDPAGAGTFDPRSHARRTLDLLQAAIEGRLPNGLESYNVAGRDIRKIAFKELVAMRDRYASMVAAEDAQASGRSGLRNHVFRFSNP